MKINIRAFTIKHLRNNSLYFYVVGATIFAFMTIGLFFLYQIKLYSNKISLLEHELEDLKKKKEFIDYKGKIVQNDINIASLNKIFATLVPSEEDIFSISLALESISLKSGFAIYSYMITPSESAKGRLTFTVQGQGNLDIFIAFLKVYSFTAGRLITVSEAKYSTKPFPSAKVTLSFYSGSPSNKSVMREYSEKQIALLRDIMKKTAIEIKANESDTLEYPVKSNPF